MYKNKTILAIIPARGGSKGIPKKNIVLVNNKPLIQYTIDEALSSKYLDDIIVSTDDMEIAEISKNLGAQVPFLRPDFLADDYSKTIDSLIYTIQQLEKFGKYYNYIVTLQPTQPLRKNWHIDEAIKKLIETNYDSLVSVSRVKEHPILMRKIKKDGTLENILNINSTVRRQDFFEYYRVNGAIYINKINDKFNTNTSLNDNQLAYIMDNKFDIDIDEKMDLELFKLITNIEY